MDNADAPAPPPVPKKGHGCFFWGCLTSVVLVLLFTIGVIVVVKLFVNRANRFITQYAEMQPVKLPVVTLPADELNSVLTRLTNFSQALDDHTNTPPLVLTGPQVNALLASRQELDFFKGKYFISFEDSSAKAQISLPLGDLPLIGRLESAKGRYLNGTGTFNLGVSNGFLVVHLIGLEVRGQPVSAQFLANVQRNNWADSANRGADTNTFQELESIVVTNGTLVIQAKSY